MSTETIREFLVSLGFKTDESGLKKFGEGIETATKSILKLAAAIEGVALGMVVMVTKFASNMETLYFASRRVGTSAAHLKSLELAAQNIGLSAGEATGAVEALSEALARNPAGNKGLLDFVLGKAGLTSKKNAEGIVDSADAVLKLSQAFKAWPEPIAIQFADQLGISYSVFRQLKDYDLVGEYNKKIKEMSPNLDAAAKDSNRFMSDIRDLELQLEMVGVEAEHSIRDKLFGSLENLNKWIQGHRTELGDSLATAINGITDAATGLATVLGKIIDDLKWFDQFSGGLSTKILGLGLAFRLFGGGAIASGLWSLLKKVPGVGALAGGAGSIGAAALSRLALPTAVGAGVGAGWLFDELFPNNWLARLGRWTGDSLYDSTHRHEDALRFFTDRGWKPWQSAGIVANLDAESEMSPTATGDHGNAAGIGQWHPDRQLDFKRLFGKDIRDSSFTDQLNFVDWELRNKPEYGAAVLRASQTSQDAARAFSRFYERPAGGEAEAERRAGIAAHISQANTFHIASSDPARAADQVDSRLRQINSGLVRSFALLAQ